MKISSFSNQSFGVKCPINIKSKVKKGWGGMTYPETISIVGNLKSTGSEKSVLKNIIFNKSVNPLTKNPDYEIYIKLKTGNSFDKQIIERNFVMENKRPTKEDVNYIVSWLIQDAECEYIKSRLHTSMGKAMAKKGGFEENCKDFLSDYETLCKTYPKEQEYLNYVFSSFIGLQ